jgi:microcompartment protein CcmK/EutM
MQLGRIVGKVVATQKDDALEGKTLLLIQPLDKQGRDRGRALVGVDAVGSGSGEIIYWCRGREASLAWYPDQSVPTECSIVGIVDAVHLE